MNRWLCFIRLFVSFLNADRLRANLRHNVLICRTDIIFKDKIRKSLKDLLLFLFFGYGLAV